MTAGRMRFDREGKLMGIHDGTAVQEEKVVTSRKSWLYYAASMRS